MQKSQIEQRSCFGGRDCPIVSWDRNSSHHPRQHGSCDQDRPLHSRPVSQDDADLLLLDRGHFCGVSRLYEYG